MQTLTDNDLRVVEEIAQLLRPEQRVLFVTGAGMSADSGLPTYRGVGGLYNSGETEEGMPIEQLLSGPVFRRRPELTWKYLGQIEESARTATFNRGHQVIAEMEEFFEDVCVLTQNIDGFHLDAGSTNVIEIHGNLHHLICTQCTHEKSVHTFDEISIPPDCDRCTHLMRPKVVLFEEMLLASEVDKLAEQWNRGFDVVFSVGTTSVFPYIAEPVYFASDRGLPAIEINPDDTCVSSLCTLRLRSSAAVALDALWARIK